MLEPLFPIKSIYHLKFITMEEQNQKKKKGCLKAAGFTALGLFLLIMIFVAIPDKEEQEQSAPTAAVQTGDNKSVWYNYIRVDEMSGDTIYYKKVKSENTIEFSFPYSGGSTFDLTVRGRQGEEPDIILSTDNGQFMPSFGSDEYVRIKFDDNEAFKVYYNCASDGSLTTIFLNSVPRLLKEMKKAKKVKIEPNFFEDGRKIIEFEIDGFDWEH